MSHSTHYRRRPSAISSGRPARRYGRGAALRCGVTTTAGPGGGTATRDPYARSALYVRLPVQNERPADLDRFVQRISYRAVLGDRKLDCAQGVRPVDTISVHDIAQVHIGEPGRGRVGAFALHLDGQTPRRRTALFEDRDHILGGTGGKRDQ